MLKGRFFYQKCLAKHKREKKTKQAFWLMAKVKQKTDGEPLSNNKTDRYFNNNNTSIDAIRTN